MDIPTIDTIKEHLNQDLKSLENLLNADVLVFSSPILDGMESEFRHIVEQLANDPSKKESLYIMLTTSGGSAIAVERFVNIVRHYYGVVNFIIPDHAYSAGTIFCMSGNEILMDYFSVLGPIDPQVRNREGKYVPALGYLDKVEGLLCRAKEKDFTQAEFLLLKEMDLAELRLYEQAKDLTIDLLKEWLVKYKFKNWSTHKSSGNAVTDEEKQQRAQEIASTLSDNKRWKSHARPINMYTLQNELKLRIEDFGQKDELKKAIKEYHDLMSDFVNRNKVEIFIHTRLFI